MDKYVGVRLIGWLREGSLDLYPLFHSIYLSLPPSLSFSPSLPLTLTLTPAGR